jgi:FMN reductase
MNSNPLIVGIGGTTRQGSTAERALSTALARANALGCKTELFGASVLPSEMFDPNRPDRSDRATALIAALRRCDGVIIASPSYHGGISGLVKNAIDYVEDMRGDERVYLQDRAVGCIVCADGPQAMGATLAALRAVVHSLRGWPTPYGATLNTRNRPFGGEGSEPDPAAIEACETVADEVVRMSRLLARERSTR